MKTYIRDSDRIPLTAPTGGVVADRGYLIGAMFVVAAASAPAGATFTAQIEGVIDLPKAASITPAPGALLYWDDTNKVVTTTASGNTKIGVHAGPAASGASDATVPVRLNGSF